MTTCSLIGYYHHFEAMCCLHFQGKKVPFYPVNVHSTSLRNVSNDQTDYKMSHMRKKVMFIITAARRPHNKLRDNNQL